MSDLKVIEPIEILDSMVGSSFTNEVLEGDYAEYAAATTYADGDRVIVKTGLGIFGEAVSMGYTIIGMCAAPNGDVYALSVDGKVYVQNGGDGDFVLLQTIGLGTNHFQGMCAAPNGDVYFACFTSGGTAGDIYKRTGGSGLFASMSQTDRAWYGMCATPSGAIWACVYGGDLYKLVGATFTAQSIGTKNWYGMAAAPNGDIYASVDSGDIWVSTNAGVSFSAIADTDRAWRHMASDANGDVFASVYSGDIYKRTAGAGTFAALGNTSRSWYGVCVNPITEDMYAAATTYIYISRYDPVHKIYESLEGSNVGNFPPADVKATTPKWLEVSATNKWKVFDGVVADQMAKVSPAVYSITPGTTFTGIACLNLEATSVRIQTSSSGYDSTVSTGANDVVKLDLAGTASDVITITITNSAGLAKCGEIVIGTVTTIGTLKPQPVVGITDYSVKEQDEWGNWSVTERAYSEKLSCVAGITYSSLDTVIALLKEYRATPLVWVGNTSYSCLIIYGYVKDWNVPVETRGKALMSLEIEGLT